MESVAKIGVGVDVSKAQLDVYIVPVGQSFSVENTKQGVKKLAKKLSIFEHVDVGCESTGGYENFLVQGLRDKTNICLFKFNPRRVAHFKKSMGKEAKTDRLDAIAIAKLAVLEDESRCVAKTMYPNHELLQRLFAQKRHFKKMLASTRTFAKSPLIKDTQHADSIIKALEEVIDQLNTQIESIIATDSNLQEKINLIQSIPGCGIETSLAITACVPEVGTIDSRPLSALVGLAPFTRESGTWVGKSFIRFGRQEPREALYMAALSASRYNPTLKKFYDQLVAKGKPKKVALIAVSRKLLCTMNAMLRNKTTWRNCEVN